VARGAYFPKEQYSHDTVVSFTNSPGSQLPQPVRSANEILPTAHARHRGMPSSTTALRSEKWPPGQAVHSRSQGTFETFENCPKGQRTQRMVFEFRKKPRLQWIVGRDVG